MNYLSPPELKKICTLMKLYCDCSQHELTGIKDTKFKMYACYLATKVTDLSIGRIANYFNIYPKYLKNELVEMAIYYHITDHVAPKIIDRLAAAYKELEALENA